MEKDVIIALDFPTAEQTLSFLGKFGEKKPFVKIGMELFYAEGPAVIRAVKDLGHKIFLDLKLHDIPHTVEMAMRVLAGLDVDMVNCHASGTVAMMEAALRGLEAGCLDRQAGGADSGGVDVAKRPMIIAVTQLTSTDEERMRRDLLIERPLDEVVKAYAKNARDAGLDGVVCSPLESSMVHETCGGTFITVTPGIRLAGDAKGDQKRVTTPADASALGSDFIVVGRSITAAADPVAAYERCVEEFLG